MEGFSYQPQCKGATDLGELNGLHKGNRPHHYWDNARRSGARQMFSPLPENEGQGDRRRMFDEVQKYNKLLRLRAFSRVNRPVGEQTKVGRRSVSTEGSSQQKAAYE